MATDTDQNTTVWTCELKQVGLVNWKEQSRVKVGGK